jgi:hypothetical protein
MMIKMLEMAAIEGSTPCSMAVNILMGSVVSLTFNRNIVTGTLSNEMMKENNPPATSPGRIIGNVTNRKAVHPFAPNILAASSTAKSLPGI